MEPKEKAKDLFDKVDKEVCGDINRHNQKDMAILICDEIISALEGFAYTGTFFDHPMTGKMVCSDDIDPCTYWYQVKKELEAIPTS